MERDELWLLLLWFEVLCFFWIFTFLGLYLSGIWVDLLLLIGAIVIILTSGYVYLLFREVGYGEK